MTTFLIVRGMEPVELDESFNSTRQKVNQSITGTKRDGSEKDGKDAARPLHEVTFFTADGGRFAPVPEHILGVGSDMRKDGEEDDE